MRPPAWGHVPPRRDGYGLACAGVPLEGTRVGGRRVSKPRGASPKNMDDVVFWGEVCETQLRRGESNRRIARRPTLSGWAHPCPGWLLVSDLPIVAGCPSFSSLVAKPAFARSWWWWCVILRWTRLDAGVMR